MYTAALQNDLYHKLPPCYVSSILRADMLRYRALSSRIELNLSLGEALINIMAKLNVYQQNCPDLFSEKVLN